MFDSNAVTLSMRRVYMLLFVFSLCQPPHLISFAAITIVFFSTSSQRTPHFYCLLLVKQRHTDKKHLLFFFKPWHIVRTLLKYCICHENLCFAFIELVSLVSPVLKMQREQAKKKAAHLRLILANLIFALR